MKNKISVGDLSNRYLLIFIAGMGGGLIEVIWVVSYGMYASISATNVARQITATVLPILATSSVAPVLGLFIHFVLSVVLAYAFVIFVLEPVSRLYGKPGIFLACMATLFVVWAMNFLLILPAINSTFVSLMPYLVTLISKLLFGLAMAIVFMSCKINRQIYS